MPKTIILTQEKYTCVDNFLYDCLNQYKWLAHKYHDGKNWYAERGQWINNKVKTIKMHRFIWEITKGPIPFRYTVDHRDGNGLNNRIKNLRLATKQQNVHNRRHQNGCTSKYKGVSWNIVVKKWLSRIMVNRVSMHLGYFENEIDAAIAYDKAAIKYHKEFSRLNFPQN